MSEQVDSTVVYYVDFKYRFVTKIVGFNNKLDCYVVFKPADEEVKEINDKIAG